MVNSRHPNTSVIPTKADHRITVTIQAGVATHDRRLRLGITSSMDGPHSLQLGCIERLVGQLENGVGSNLLLACIKGLAGQLPL